MKFFCLLSVLIGTLSYAQKIVMENDQLVIYYPKAYEGDDDGLEPQDYVKIQSLYDTIYSVGYKDYYLAVDRTLGREHADLFYTAYGSHVCFQIQCDSISYFWQEGNSRETRYYGSTPSGRIFKLIHSTELGEAHFEEDRSIEAYVCRNLKTMKEGLFSNGKRITGFIYDEIKTYSGKYSPSIFVGEGEGGYTIYNDMGARLTQEPVDGYSNNGFFYTEFWTRVWKDGQYGLVFDQPENVIPPREFYAPFHCIEGSLGEHAELKANRDAKVNKYSYNMGGLSEWYCFPMSRKWPLHHFPVKNEDKVGLINRKNELVLPYEYDELYSYYIVGTENEHFVVGKKNEEWLFYKDGFGKAKRIEIDAWINYGDCVGDEKYFGDAFVLVDGKLRYMDVKSLEILEPGIKEGTVKSVQNAHGLFALFDHEGNMLRDFSEQMIIDEFAYFIPEENDTGFVLMKPEGGRIFPDAVSHITPSYTAGMYLVHQGEKAGIFSIMDDKYIPLSKSFAELNYFALDGGYANLRLDAAYLTEKDSLYGVIDFRNNELLPAAFEEVFWNCDYEDEQAYELSNTELISAVGYKEGSFYVHNASYTKLKKVKADKLVSIKSNGFVFVKKGKVFAISKETLKNQKNWDYSNGTGNATKVWDNQNRQAGYGLIDADGYIILDFEMRSIRETDYGSDDQKYFEIENKHEKHGMYSVKGKLMLDIIYDDILAVIGKRYDKIFTVRKGETEALILIDAVNGTVKWLTEFELKEVTYKRNVDANMLYFVDGRVGKVDRAGVITMVEGDK